jgi:hypothetical protein
MGDLTLVDQEPQVGLSLQDHLRDLIEGDLDDRWVAAVEPEEERRRGVAAREFCRLADWAAGRRA